MKRDKNKNRDNEEEYSQDIVNLVVARLETVPANVHISIGSEGNFSVSDIIKRVKAKDEIGKKMIKVQLDHIRSLQKLTIE